MDMNIFWGIIGVIIGVLVIKYSMPITDTFGRISWAEDHLHGGMAGTYTFYKLAGLLVIILSLLYMFGGIGFVLGPLGGFFSGTQ